MITLAIDQTSLQELQADAEISRCVFENPLHPDTGSGRWGVERNTIRAYRGFAQPLERYNQWACNASQKFLRGHYAGCDFPAIHQKLTASLCQNWANLSVAQRYKLVDLFVLRMSYFAPLCCEIRTLLWNEGHPALDKFTLCGLSKMVPGLVIGTPSMGAIETKDQYNGLQSAIRQITQQAGIPNLNFDIWCWPAARRQMFNLPNT